MQSCLCALGPFLFCEGNLRNGRTVTVTTLSTPDQAAQWPRPHTCCRQEHGTGPQIPRKADVWTIQFLWSGPRRPQIDKLLGTEWSAPLRNRLAFVCFLWCNKKDYDFPLSPKKAYRLLLIRVPEIEEIKFTIARVTFIRELGG